MKSELSDEINNAIDAYACAHGDRERGIKVNLSELRQAVDSAIDRVLGERDILKDELVVLKTAAKALVEAREKAGWRIGRNDENADRAMNRLIAVLERGGGK